MTLFDLLRQELPLIATFTDERIEFIVEQAGAYATGTAYAYDNTTLAADVPSKEILIMIFFFQYYLNCLLCGAGGGGTSVVNADKKTIKDADNTIVIESSSSSGTNSGSTCDCTQLKKDLDGCITDFYGTAPVAANLIGLVQVGSCVKP